jgi:hypothetical protein
MQDISHLQGLNQESERQTKVEHFQWQEYRRILEQALMWF